ncbi:MAG: TRAP transporter small permease [Bacteroidota bacterium]
MRGKVNNALEKLLLIIISVMLLSVIWQVISRYLLGTPSTLTDEIASYALIWLGLYGAAYASGKELHLAIDLVPAKVVSKNPLVFSGIVSLAIITFALLVMVIGGMRLCYLTYLLGQRSAALEVPLAFVYSALPISGLLITYYSMDSFLQTRRKTLKD